MLNQSVIIALLVLSIWYTMQDGEIFGVLGNWFEHNLPGNIHPAVFECNVCMSPWYGSLLYWLLPWDKLGLHYEANVWRWIPCIIVAMGINIVINKLSHEHADE